MTKLRDVDVRTLFLNKAELFEVTEHDIDTDDVACRRIGLVGHDGHLLAARNDDVYGSTFRGHVELTLRNQLLTTKTEEQR